MKPIKHEAVPPSGTGLWDKYFKVRMLYLHSRNVDQVRRFGVRISGVEEIDRGLDKQEIVTEMNIDRMFEKWRTGVTIRVVNYNDTLIIYRIIHAHLIAWAEYMASGINNGNVPIKDLIELDDFANVVYDKARSVFSQEEKQTALASNFLQVQTINFQNILKREYNQIETKITPSGAEVTRVTKTAPSVVVPDRNSLKSLFAEQINQISGWKERE